MDTTNKKSRVVGKKKVVKKAATKKKVITKKVSDKTAANIAKKKAATKKKVVSKKAPAKTSAPKTESGPRTSPKRDQFIKLMSRKSGIAVKDAAEKLGTTEINLRSTIGQIREAGTPVESLGKGVFRVGEYK